MELKKLLDFDRDHIWHPYTSMIDPLKVYAVSSADGVYINLKSGQRLIDGMSSWWCMVHGYNNKVLNRAITDQVGEMAHVMFGGLTHQPAVELAGKLISAAPSSLTRVFYSDSGSVSVEVAVKMALQYMQASGRTSRTKIATVMGGYHGDTWHAMSVCDPVGGMHSLYSGRLPVQYFAPRPEIPFDGEWNDSDFEPMRRLLEENESEIAAVILEPIVQGAGGMWFYHPQYLSMLREECDKYGLLLIADEIATGFWRTGKIFASEWAGIEPDIMCVGKAVTGGYMSFAATLATDRVAMTISENNPHVFMHGPTFMGNPLACAVASASLDLLNRPQIPATIARIEQKLKENLTPARNSKGVADVRVLGAIGVVEMKKSVDMESFQARCVEKGVWIRPFGKLVYIMPPYIITDDELDYLCRSMLEIIDC